MATPPPSPQRFPLWLLPALLVAIFIGATAAHYFKDNSKPDDSKVAKGKPSDAKTDEVKPSDTPEPEVSVTPSMIWIPGGTFLMGSDDPTSRFKDAKPIHEVTIKGFFIDKYEVTNAQFAEFVAATGYKTVAERAPDKAEIMSKAGPGARA